MTDCTPETTFIATPRTPEEQAAWLANARQPKWVQDGFDSVGAWAQAMLTTSHRARTPVTMCNRPADEERPWYTLPGLHKK